MRTRAIMTKVALNPGNVLAHEWVSRTMDPKRAREDVSSGSVQTSTAEGQKVFDVSFSEKKTYRLSDPSGPSTYDSVTRTAQVEYYAKNPILVLQSSRARGEVWVVLFLVNLHK